MPLQRVQNLVLAQVPGLTARTTNQPLNNQADDEQPYIDIVVNGAREDLRVVVRERDRRDLVLVSQRRRRVTRAQVPNLPTDHMT